MKATERKIIYKCYTTLQALPGKNNAMSSTGASQYHEEMRQAVGLNARAMMYLLDGEYEIALSFANELVMLVYDVLRREGLSISASMEELKKSIKP